MLIVLGPSPDLLAFRDQAMGRMVQYDGEGWHRSEWNGPREDPLRQELCFNNFVPVLRELTQRPRWPEGRWDATDQESGGAWERKHWGCEFGARWSRGEIVEPQVIRYHFETVNAVALPAIEAISRQWPTCQFELFWQAEWELFDPTHLTIYANGRCLNNLCTEVSMYCFRPSMSEAEARAEGYFSRWRDFRDSVDDSPDWSELRQEIEQRKSNT